MHLTQLWTSKEIGHQLHWHWRKPKSLLMKVCSSDLVNLNFCWTLSHLLIINARLFICIISLLVDACFIVQGNLKGAESILIKTIAKVENSESSQCALSKVCKSFHAQVSVSVLICWFQQNCLVTIDWFEIVMWKFEIWLRI